MTRAAVAPSSTARSLEALVAVVMACFSSTVSLASSAAVEEVDRAAGITSPFRAD
jgi:hypothetical protein